MYDICKNWPGDKMYMYLEILKVYMRQAAHSEVQVMCSEEAQQLQRDNRRHSTPYSLHPLIALKLSKSQLPHTTHKLLTT